MENYWFLILVTISIAFLLKSFVNLFSSSSAGKQSLPPSPARLPFIGNLLLFGSGMEQVLRSVRDKHATPAVTLYVGSQPSIFVADGATAHRALVQNGAVFADRPTRSLVHTIGLSPYGPTWRLLRRNLTAEILHPSRLKNYSDAREWALELLKSRIVAFGSEPFRVFEPFQLEMFRLFVYMCFGEKLEGKEIVEIEQVVRQVVLNFPRFTILDFAPRITRILLRKRWSEFLQLWKDEADVLLRLIRSRKRKTEEGDDTTRGDRAMFYIDTLLNLELPEEKRKLTEMEIVSLCNEFLNGGTDTTSNILQWIMANVVKYPDIQTKLFDEIKSLVGETRATEIKEEDLQKLPYLKAVVLEGLRRHPPGHFLMPHAVTSTAELGVGGYAVPKGAVVNFMVAEIGRDPKVWEDPMSFKPERFLGDTNPFDITSSKEIKMMPFGAGRRICPAYELGILHLEYFLANLIWSFEWKAVGDKEVDLTGKELWFAEVMKNPLTVQASPRFAMH
ncbi:Cytochrome P450 89A2 [Linum grandiflorum]